MLFPVNREAHPDTQALRDHLFDLRKKGFNRLFQNGRTFEFSTPESLLDIDFAQPLYVLADRIAIRPELHQRIVDTVEICYRESGEVLFENAATGARLRFSERFECKSCGHGVRRTGAVAVQLQQPHRRLPALPGLRQHHRFRHGPGHPG